MEFLGLDNLSKIEPFNKLSLLLDNLNNFFNPVYLIGAIAILMIIYLSFWLLLFISIKHQQKQTNSLLQDIKDQLYRIK